MIDYETYAKIHGDASWEPIIALAARFKLPAVYSERFWVSGGLISHGSNVVYQYSARGSVHGSHSQG